MTAISQYAYQLCSPRLTDAAQLRQAVTAISAVFIAMWPVLTREGFTSCVLDFAVVPPSQGDGSWRAALIEVNPFEETTDGALFSWTRERDVIEGKAEGAEYPVVRVTEVKRVASLSMMPRDWRDIIAKVERELKLV